MVGAANLGPYLLSCDGLNAARIEMANSQHT
jgi:hypothetical protein